MGGIVRAKPKLAPDAVTIRLFGPGEIDIDTAKVTIDATSGHMSCTFRCPSNPTGLPFRPIWNAPGRRAISKRSEEHTSELQSLMRISYAVFCLKKKKQQQKY